MDAGITHGRKNMLKYMPATPIFKIHHSKIGPFRGVFLDVRETGKG